MFFNKSGTIDFDLFEKACNVLKEFYDSKARHTGMKQHSCDSDHSLSYVKIKMNKHSISNLLEKNTYVGYSLTLTLVATGTGNLSQIF